MARILLADDDRGSLELLRRALESDGHSVVAAEDGSEALEQLSAAGPFDLLVTDIQMPGLDGIALSGKAVALVPGIRLLLISAYPDVLERARSVRASAMRLVAKPVSIERLRKEVRSVLGA